ERVLDQMIQQEYLISTAENLGYVVPRGAIRHLVQQNTVFHKNGRFDPLLYKQMVARPGLYEKEIASQTKFMGLSELFQGLASMVSPLEEEQNNKLSISRNFELLAVDTSSFPEPSKVSDAEVAAFLKKSDSGQVIEQYYNSHIDQFKKEEQIRARHILVKGPD